MQALVYREKGAYPVLEEIEIEENQYSEETVEVKMIASALNRRDYYITQGLYPGVVPDTIMGSDGLGEYDGKRVLINPNIKWGNRTEYQSAEYEVLGMPKHGTFAEKIHIPAHRLHEAPEHLNDIEAAALPLGGMTAWRAIHSKARVEKGDKVLISGVGGGVAQFAMQYAIALGAETYVTSGSAVKIDKAIQLGAEGGVMYSEEKWYDKLAALSGGFDAIIDSAGGDGFHHFIPLCNPGGRIVFYGGTHGKISGISPQIMFWRQLSIMGTTMASDDEFVEMLNFVAQHKIKPQIAATYELSESEAAFEMIGKGSSFGKIVFEHGK